MIDDFKFNPHPTEVKKISYNTKLGLIKPNGLLLIFVYAKNQGGLYLTQCDFNLFH